MSTVERINEEQVSENVSDEQEVDEEVLGKVFHMGTLMRVMGVRGELSMAEIALAGRLVAVWALVKDPSCRDEYNRLSPRIHSMAATTASIDINVIEELAEEIDEVAQDDGSVEGTIVGSSFEMGKVTISDSIQRHTRPTTILEYLASYAKRNWGDLMSERETAENNRNADQKYGLIFAIYPIDSAKPDDENNRIYIITEADRSKTRVILASEY